MHADILNPEEYHPNHGSSVTTKLTLSKIRDFLAVCWRFVRKMEITAVNLQ
jgi:hypothetical protein